MPLPPPLVDLFPRLAGRLDFAALGAWPTPVEQATELVRALGRPELELWIKRDDRSSMVYGGNKVRTLEALFGAALARGQSSIVATGAYGSNHAVATVLHAPRVGLSPGALLFGQPPTPWALRGLRTTLSYAARVTDAVHWSMLPAAMAFVELRARVLREPTLVMAPGGATPLGSLGYVAAALELAAQVAKGALPAPRAIYVGLGSNATSAGLLVGLRLAARARLGFTEPPRLVAVRITPWPVTSRLRLLDLAARTARLLADLAGDPTLRLSASELSPPLDLEARFLGRGYAEPTPEGLDAVRLFRETGLFELDTTYAGKVVAALVVRIRQNEPGPLLFWSTRSTTPLPPEKPEALARAPRGMRRWLARAEREIARTFPLERT